jgi:hypothetical protein
MLSSMLLKQWKCLSFYVFVTTLMSLTVVIIKSHDCYPLRKILAFSKLTPYLDAIVEDRLLDLGELYELLVRCQALVIFPRRKWEYNRAVYLLFLK